MRASAVPLAAMLSCLAAPLSAQAVPEADLSPEQIGAAAYGLNAQLSCARGDADAPRAALLSADAQVRRVSEDAEGLSAGVRSAFDRFVAEGACGSLAGAGPDDHRRYLEERSDSVRARGEISGLASLLWGAPVSAIVQAHGPPDGQEVDAEAGVLVLRYAPREIFDTPAQLFFVVHRTEGMIGGGYTVPIGLTADCDAIFDRFTGELRERYSRLRPAVRRHNSNRALLFCHALRFGRAEASAVWTAPANRATLSLSLGDEHLHVLYSTPRYAAIRAWQRERTRWRVF
ncbi:MAG TPA: hypothetical protein VHG51_06310 [Longimicrobiaceae bacterium]|nr:hypothetical protein [Longimicrobiaceae bacterium]